MPLSAAALKTLPAVLISFLVKLVLTLIVLSLGAFLLLHLTPGDPLQAFYGDAAERLNAAQRAAALHRLGLDAPLWQQYLSWGWRVLHFDFGMSLTYKMPVGLLLPPLILNTLILGLSAYLITFAAALLLALICARWEERLIDKLICRLGTLCCFLPAFWAAVLLLLLFSVNLQLLPSSGAYDPGQADSIVSRLKHLILPVLVLSLSHVWFYGYLLRGRLLIEVREQYVLTAKALGQGTWGILTAQCLRAMLPFILNLMAISVPHIIGGTYVAEAVFNYPGIGNLAVESAKNHDYNLLLTIVLLTCVLVVLAAGAARALSERLDPRLKARRGTLWQR